MDKVTNDIGSLLFMGNSQSGPTVVQLATVGQINGDDTITAELISGLIVDDVRLRSVVKDGNRIIIEPAPGSQVLIASIDNGGEYVVIAVEEINRVYVKIGELEFELSDKLMVKNGADTLKDALTMIVEAVQQVTVIYGNNPDYGKLTQALEKINNLLA